KTLRTMVEKIKASGANVLLGQKGIDDVAQHFLAKEGIYGVRRVKESDMKKLAKATGARIVTNLDDLTAKELGRAELVEERKVGTDDMTFVTGCKNARAVSILIRGGTEHVVDEVERILHDALRVVSAAIEDGKAIPGGGSAEIELSLALQSYAASVGGREQLAIEAFAGALEVIPRALGENAGLDPIDVLIKLRAAHGKKGGKAMGVDVTSGEPLDMLKANVVEPLRVKVQEIDSAAEVASMILRIDDLGPFEAALRARRMPGDLDPEARLDALRRHDPRRMVGPRLHDVHPGRPPGRLDRLPDGLHGLVERSTRIEAEAGGSSTRKSRHEHEDREDEQEHRDREQGHAAVRRVAPQGGDGHKAGH